MNARAAVDVAPAGCGAHPARPLPLHEEGTAVRRSCGTGLTSLDGGTGELSCGRGAFLQEYRLARLAKTAFACLSAGHPLPPAPLTLGDAPSSPCGIPAVAVAAAAFMGATEALARLLVRRKRARSGITAEELRCLGMEPDVESAVSDSVASNFQESRESCRPAESP